MVPLLHAATTDIFVRQLQALVTPGMQIADDLVDAWIWWFNANHPDQGGVLVPHLGWAHTLIAPPTNPRQAPSTGSRERAALQPRANTLKIPPDEDLQTGKAGQLAIGGATSGTWWSSTRQERRRHAQGPHNAKVNPAPSP